MDIAETTKDVHEHREGLLCVMADSTEDDRAIAAVTAWSLPPPTSVHPIRRPSVHSDGQGLEIVLLVLGEEREQHPLRMFVSDRGLLLLASEPVRSLVRDAVRGAEGIWAAVVAVTLSVARHCEARLDQLEDQGEGIEARATGFTSSPQRRAMGRLRSDLFRIQEIQAVLHRLTSPEEELAQSLPEQEQGRLRRAAAVFDANRSACSRLYAMLGDLLAEQGALVSERLTLVAMIFLPLTLVTGFFGMNFVWLQDRTGSAGAFFILGVVLPVLAALLTLAVVRHLTRSP